MLWVPITVEGKHWKAVMGQVHGMWRHGKVGEAAVMMAGRSISSGPLTDDDAAAVFASACFRK